MTNVTTPDLDAAQFVKIPPSPKVLKVLGNIELDLWACVAELIDNCFDEFLEIKRAGIQWNDPFEVKVSLPTTLDGAAAIEVRDNGRGMTLDHVIKAVKAGFSTNDPFSKLGLFGMGFNVATARLGMKTRFLTTRAGDAEWIGVEIDLNNINQEFEAPVVREKKGSPGEHGTRVTITNLENRTGNLTKAPSKKKLREILGGVYSYLLDSEGFRLFVDDIRVNPIRHCVWDESRSVTRKGEQIPARIEIDEPLADRAVCYECRTWQNVENEVCEECGSEQVEVRQRRVWGWVGVQRYLDAKEFGIDFIRNGRKIARYDKSVFLWQDPDDPSGQGDIEYPIELPNNRGRIVGELHLDHVPVNYLKNAFETNDVGWRKALEMLRGKGPLLPERAKQLGYGENNSPLARLHRGYRRNDPGLNYLFPGNGKTGIDTKDWGQKFRDGDAEYQTDQKWWDAVQKHEDYLKEEKRAKEERERAASKGDEDPTEEFRVPPTTLGDPSTTSTEGTLTSTVAPPPAAPKAPAKPTAEEPAKKLPTEADLVDLYLSKSTTVDELNKEYSVTGVGGRPVKLSVHEVKGVQVKNPAGKRVPVWLASRKGGSFAAFIDTAHPHFSTFDDDPADLVLMELAQHLIMRAQGEAPTVSVVFAALKDRYLISRSIDQSKLVGLATQLLRDIQQHMVACVQDNAERPWQNALNPMEREATGDRIALTLKTADINSVVNSGQYLEFVPATVVPRIVEEWPEAFFDGKLFQAPYADLESSSARRQTVATVTGYLNDVAWLATPPFQASREQLIRARLSLQLLPDETVALDV